MPLKVVQVTHARHVALAPRVREFTSDIYYVCVYEREREREREKERKRETERERKREGRREEERMIPGMYHSDATP